MRANTKMPAGEPATSSGAEWYRGIAGKSTDYRLISGRFCRDSARQPKRTGRRDSGALPPFSGRGLGHNVGETLRKRRHMLGVLSFDHDTDDRFGT